MDLAESVGDVDWLLGQFEGLTDEDKIVRPSEWAEECRVLPVGSSTMPGPYRFAVAPYLREIVDCMSVDSPVREIAVMKGVQVCFTSGVIENALGYGIGHIKTAPMMLVTADAELAKLRVETAILPMIRESGLQDRIRSSDDTNKRKTGQTAQKIEWVGGGFLIPFGAVNANKLRSIPIQILFRDEVDGWPLVVGKDGDPMALSFDRTATFEDSRKVFDGSTPNLKGQSRIEARFLLGDQRYYHVPCRSCGHMQVLRWHRVNAEGVVSGVVWERDEDGKLVPGSVRYLCEACGHPHTNEDKVWMLDPANGAKWIPTAKPSHPNFRSYHLSALYSPVGMQSWEACAQKWLEAWDVDANAPRDINKLQVFYNNVLGQTFEVMGEKVSFASVSAHRRQCYLYGEIPNRFAKEFAGSEVQLVTCAVDVHGDAKGLKIAVVGWARSGRPFLIEYLTALGDVTNIEGPAWQLLREVIEQREYIADDGKKYRVQITLIDSGYRPDDVYRFCSDYASGVFPVRGVPAPQRGSVRAEFATFVTKLGTQGFNITVDIYKDRWSASLRKHWDGISQMPEWFFSAPMNATDQQLKELTVERKVELKDKRTGQRVGWEWRRPSGARNELWDLLIYNSAAVEIVAADVCRSQYGAETVNWPAFWQFVQDSEAFIAKD